MTSKGYFIWRAKRIPASGSRSSALFEVFKARVFEDKSQWSKFVDDYQIAKVDEHKAIMVMNVLDFEAIAAFPTTDEMRAWDADHGCLDMVYSLSPIA